MRCCSSPPTKSRYLTGVTLPIDARQLPEVTLAELSIPQGWEAITPGWMTTALAAHHPAAVVADVRVALRDDGTNQRARLELTYSAGSGPATVFAKAVDPAPRRARRAHQRSVPRTPVVLLGSRSAA